MADTFKDRGPEIEALVQKAQEGDTDAFAKLYDFYVDAIYRYIYFKVAQAEALDLTEAVFLKVWENLHSYRKNGSGFSAWIFRIAHNLVVDHYRLKKEIAPLTTDIASDKRDNDPVYNTEKILNQGILQNAISRLNKKYQQIIVLKYLNDLDNDEIAHILKKSEGSVRILKFRALKALKRALLEMGAQF